MEGWELVYVRCGATFDAVRLVQLKKSSPNIQKTKPKTTRNNPPSIIQQPKYSFKKKQRNNHFHNISLIPTKKYIKQKFTIFLKIVETKNMVV